MDTADLRVVSSNSTVVNTLHWRYPTGTSSRVSCYVGKNSLLLLYSSGSPRPSSFNYGNECASFPQTHYARKCSAAGKSTICKCSLIQTPCHMCIAVGTTVEEVDVCHLSKCVDFGLHHESNTSNHFNCSELSTSSYCLYGAVVCSRDTAYATHWIQVIAYLSIR
jgi:hypothetical protein